MLYYSKKEAEDTAHINSKVFPKYKFTVRTVKGRHEDYYAVNVTRRVVTKARR